MGLLPCDTAPLLQLTFRALSTQSLELARQIKVIVLNLSFVRPNFPPPASMHMPTRVGKRG